MSIETPEPPPGYSVLPPEPQSPPRHKPPPKGLWGAILAVLVVIGKFLAPIAKFGVVIFKFAKLGKLLLTGGTMLLSIVIYAQIFGWWFAVGFVVCIFIHEMGHVLFAWRMGLPVSAPVFIPYMGAFITLKEIPRNSYIDAVVGIGGPIFGTLSGLACWGLFSLTSNYLFLGLAFMAFFMNLFNMTPMYPLDGGRIVSAVSPWLWIAGLVVLIWLYVSDTIHNPFIWILIILSVPHIWNRLRHRSLESDDISLNQRLGMGAAYIGLAGFLFWAMTATHVDIEQRMRARRAAPVAVSY